MSNLSDGIRKFNVARNEFSFVTCLFSDVFDFTCISSRKETIKLKAMNHPADSGGLQ